MQTLPFLFVSEYAHPGLAFAFADREEPVRELYEPIVQAGNRVVAGGDVPTVSFVVHGHMGAGKSSVILQVLGLIRGEIRDATSPLGVGQRSLSPEVLTPVEEPHRWLILHLSGKRVGNLEAATDRIRQNLQEAGYPISFSPLGDAVHAELNQQVASRSDEIPLFARLLGREQHPFKALQEKVRSLAETLAYLRRYEGSWQAEKSATQRTESRERSAGASLKAILPSLPESGAAAELAGELVRKHQIGGSTETTVEVRRRIHAYVLVDVLNELFDFCRMKKLPTILVLDDADELVSDAGSGQERRAEVLRTVLGPLQHLRPTAFVLSLRNEYMMEDVLRPYRRVPVHPFKPPAAIDALDAWLDLQRPLFSKEDRAGWEALARKLLAPLDPELPSVIPWTYFRILSGIGHAGASANATVWQLLDSYLKSKEERHVARLLVVLSERMPASDVESCLGACPVDPTPYQLRPYDRMDLAKVGYFRPNDAGNPEDLRIILHPLVAWLKLSKEAESPRP